jgi:hypothetical protein
MAIKLEILSEVMLSLRVDQSNVMHNINVLLHNSDNQINVVDLIKEELGELSLIHSKMQECESFILQVAQSNIKQDASQSEVDDSKKT